LKKSQIGKWNLLASGFPNLRNPLTSDLQQATHQNAVTATDLQIDQLVYELYGLTPEEIALVEGAA
jgi:hypothetical protein